MKTLHCAWLASAAIATAFILSATASADTVGGSSQPASPIISLFDFKPAGTPTLTGAAGFASALVASSYDVGPSVVSNPFTDGTVFAHGAGSKPGSDTTLAAGSDVLETMLLTAVITSGCKIACGGGGVGGSVPEPATLALIGLGLIGLGWQQRRRTR